MINEFLNKITLGDCLDVMKQLPDKCIDLVLTDPPYGIGFGTFNRTNKLPDGTRVKANKYKNSDWDSNIPENIYFDEMFRVSKNQIIFGGNYFPILWNYGGKGFIFWDKNQPQNSFMDCFADGELAWTSFNKPAKRYKYSYFGNIDGNTKAGDKIHPTQKPLKLFEMILRDYFKPTEVSGGG